MRRAFNLLTDPLIRTDRSAHSLPGLLAALTRGEVAGFPAMRPHQRPAWHMFLVQLATLALRAAGQGALPDDEQTWARALRALTPDFPDDAPWCLVVEDETQAAFLQPPVPPGLKWTEVATPDALDMLITSRNHDLKSAVAQEAAAEDWIFALVSLQTMEGYGGPMNYGIARMNGGSSSRPMISLAPADATGTGLDLSGWFRRDTRRLLARTAERGGQALVWTLPWPEERQLALADLDPLCIEICRRVRLRQEGVGLRARRSTSKAARIAAKEAKGSTGDPWAPVEHKDQKGFTLGEEGRWDYRTLRRLLYSGDWKTPEMAQPDGAEASRPMIIVAQGISRGNSRTGGFQSRIVPVPKTVVRRLLATEAAEFSSQLVEDIAAVDLALRNALALAAAEGMPDKVAKAHYQRAAPARAELDRHADAAFFPALWAIMAAVSSDARLQRRAIFVAGLADEAHTIFRRTLPGIPCASLLRPRAEARAWARLGRGLAGYLGPKQSNLAAHLPHSEEETGLA